MAGARLRRRGRVAPMNKKEILSRVDHTILTTTATWEQVKKICDEGLEFGTASVCIPPRYVKKAAESLGNRLKVCPVNGVPNGYSTPEVKVFETEDAIRNGADHQAAPHRLKYRFILPQKVRLYQRKEYIFKHKRARALIFY